MKQILFFSVLLLVANYSAAQDEKPHFLIQLNGYSYLKSQLDFSASSVDISIEESESKTGSQDDSYVMFNYKLLNVYFTPFDQEDRYVGVSMWLSDSIEAGIGFKHKEISSDTENEETVFYPYLYHYKPLNEKWGIEQYFTIHAGSQKVQSENTDGSISTIDADYFGGEYEFAITYEVTKNLWLVNSVYYKYLTGDATLDGLNTDLTREVWGARLISLRMLF